MEPLLAAVLAERERRARRREELSAAYGGTVVQLTIAAPGRRKDGDDIRKAALFGAAAFERLLGGRGARTLYGETLHGEAGPCFLWVVDADAEYVKGLSIGLEEGYSLGRLWDFDVYGPGGSKLDREFFKKGPRTCFVCGSPAAVCAGRRVHELAEVERRFVEMLDRGIEDIERKGVFA